MSNAVAVIPAQQDMALDKLGAVMAQSGFFKDSKSAVQAMVKILAGREMGLGPVASMSGIHIIEGKPTIGAGLLASCVKRSGRYDYRVKTLTEKEASVEFFEGGKSIGISTFSMDDATKAGLANKGPWKSYPKNMLFARALSNGVRWYTPDVTGGPAYTPEELGAEVDDSGEAINVEAVEPTPVVPATDPFPPAEEKTTDLAALKRKVWAQAKAHNVHEDAIKSYSLGILEKNSSKEWTVSDCDRILTWITEREPGQDG